MKLWARGIDAYGESVCKPMLVSGSVERVNSGLLFHPFMLTRSRRMKVTDEVQITSIMYVDASTGLALPDGSWPWQHFGRLYSRGCTFALPVSRLTVNLPETYAGQVDRPTAMQADLSGPLGALPDTDAPRPLVA